MHSIFLPFIQIFLFDATFLHPDSFFRTIEKERCENMVNKNVEDYLQEGIYGQKQNKPEERNMYLTTLRERVEIALTIGQVMQSNVYSEVASSMRSSHSLQIFLNGGIAYPHLSKYIKLANEKMFLLQLFKIKA